MSPDGDATGERGPVSSRWRVVVAFALLGLLLGFGWGIADQPIYEATASVAVASDSQGSDVARLERFAQRGESEQVANEAAGLLGNDVAGADLLADVSVRPAANGGAVFVTATSETPDFAAAAADGFAQALVRIEGDPLELGAAASIPSSPSRNRSAILCAAVGLLIGVVSGALAAIALARSPRRRPLAGPNSAVAAVDLVGLPTVADRLAAGDGSAPRSVAVTVVGNAERAARAAIDLAESAAQAGRRVLLVDTDLDQPKLARALDLEADPGLGEYLTGDAAPREVLRSVSLGRGVSEPSTPQIACVPAGRPGPGASVSGPRFAGLVGRLARAYDLVIYSAPPILESEDADIVVGLVDSVVLVAAGASDAELGRASQLLDGSDVLGVVGDD